jgi:DNA-binding MarR family transcriptional regulator
VLTAEEQAAVDCWIRLLRAYVAMSRAINAELQAGHGLTISDYEVLVSLERAPEGQMRRTDLATSVLLSPSGITRLLDRLEEAGLVARGGCASDGRVSYAVMTDAGRSRLKDAARSHVATLQELFDERYSAEEMVQLHGLLGRLPGAHEGGPACDSED